MNAEKAPAERDITYDFLLCNRCGKCRSVCPVFPVFGEEWATARGKVELAENYFRDGEVDRKKLYSIFDLCLHCMTCEENCPAGMRADEVVMAVRADLAREGFVPLAKRLAFKVLEGMDSFFFKAMRALRLTRKAPLYCVGGRSFLSFFYPLLGWPRQRFVPFPVAKPLLRRVPVENSARGLELRLKGAGEHEGKGNPERLTEPEASSRYEWPDTGGGGEERFKETEGSSGREGAGTGDGILHVGNGTGEGAEGTGIRNTGFERLEDLLLSEEPAARIRYILRRSPLVESGKLDLQRSVDLLLRVARARRENLEKGVTAYFYAGHMTNHFYPEEGEAIVKVLNILGVDVIVPRDEVCCGAPMYFAGDIEGTRRAAAKLLERFARHSFDFIVTSCASGGFMLKKQYPRIFDISRDGFFKIEWDSKAEAFRRSPKDGSAGARYGRAVEIYKTKLEDRVFDINELLARILGLEKHEVSLQNFLFGAEKPLPGSKEAESAVSETTASESAANNRGSAIRISGSGSIASHSGESSSRWRSPIPYEEVEITAGDASKARITPAEGPPAEKIKSEETLSGMALLEDRAPEKPLRPVVTYHHPCHLNRGQDVNWQPEELLELLPGHIYRAMPDADRCCGGGGSFTFMHSAASEKIAMEKVRAIESVDPDMVVTSCPLCRMQLMDMINRYIGAKTRVEGGKGECAVSIPVTSPTELLLTDILKLVSVQESEG